MDTVKAHGRSPWQRLTPKARYVTLSFFPKSRQKLASVVLFDKAMRRPLLRPLLLTTVERAVLPFGVVARFGLKRC